MSQYAVLLTSPRQAHEALTELWHTIKPILRRGAVSELRWCTVSTPRRNQLRRRLHGPVLGQLSQQVWLYDPAAGRLVRYHPVTWKLYFKTLFLPPKIERAVDPDTGEVTTIERPASTEDLSDDQYAEFVERIVAWAVTDLGVEFDFEEDHHGFIAV